MAIKSVTSTPPLNAPILSAESSDLSACEASTEIIDFFEVNSVIEQTVGVQKDALSIKPTTDEQSSGYVTSKVKETLKQKDGAINEVNAEVIIKAQELKINADRAKMVQKVQKTLGAQTSFTTEVTIEDDAGKGILHLYEELCKIISELNETIELSVVERDAYAAQFNDLFDKNSKFRVMLLERLSSPSNDERFSQEDLINHLRVEEIFLYFHCISPKQLSQILKNKLPLIELSTKRFISIVVIEHIYSKLDDKSKSVLPIRCMLEYSDEIIQAKKNLIIPSLVIKMSTAFIGHEAKQQYIDLFSKDPYSAKFFESKFFHAVESFEQSEAVSTLVEPVKYWIAKAIIDSNKQDIANALFAICQLKKIIEPITDLDSLKQNEHLELALMKYIMLYQETLMKVVLSFERLLISRNYGSLDVETTIIIDIAINESINDFVFKIIQVEMNKDDKAILVAAFIDVYQKYDEIRAILEGDYLNKLTEVKEKIGKELIAQEEAEKLQLKTKAKEKQTSKQASIKKQINKNSKASLTDELATKAVASEEKVELHDEKVQPDDPVTLCCQLLYKCCSEDRFEAAKESLDRIVNTFVGVPLSPEENTQLAIAILDCLLLKAKQALSELLKSYKVLLTYQQKIETDFSNSKKEDTNFKKTISELPNKILILDHYLSLLEGQSKSYEIYLTMPLQSPDLQASHEMLKSELSKIISLINDVPDIPLIARQIYTQRGVKIREKFAQLATVNAVAQMKFSNEMRDSMSQLQQSQANFHDIIKRFRHVSEDLQQSLTLDDEWPTLVHQ